MKKIIFLLAFLFATITYAQTPARHYGGVILGSFASDPTGVMQGQIYWNTTDNKFRTYNGTIWTDLLAATPTLSSVLTEGNTSGANDILIENEQKITFNSPNAPYDYYIGYDSVLNDKLKIWGELVNIEAVDGAEIIVSDIINLKPYLELTGEYFQSTENGGSMWVLQDQDMEIRTEIISDDYGNDNSFFQKRLTGTDTNRKHLIGYHFSGSTADLLIGTQSSLNSTPTNIKMFGDKYTLNGSEFLFNDNVSIPAVNKQTRIQHGYSISQRDADENWGYQITAEEGFYFTDGLGSYQNNQSAISQNFIGIGNNSFRGEINATNLTLDRDYELPNANGTFALTSDISDYSDWLSYTGSTTTGNLSLKFGDYNNNTNGWYIEVGQTSRNMSFGDIDEIDNSTIFSINDINETYTFGGNNNTGAVFDVSAVSNVNLTFPSSSGQLALTSDLNDYVDLTTTQTVAGAKTFSSPIIQRATVSTDNFIALEALPNQNRIVSSNDNGTFYSYLEFAEATATHAITIPNATGTIALTSDIANVSEWAESTGTRAGADLIVNIGDYDESSTGVYLSVDINDEVVGISNSTYTGWFDPGALNLDRTYNLPDADGTLALTSDLSDYVDLTTAQTVGGVKTFTEDIKIGNNSKLLIEDTGGDFTDYDTSFAVAPVWESGHSDAIKVGKWNKLLVEQNASATQYWDYNDVRLNGNTNGNRYDMNWTGSYYNGTGGFTEGTSHSLNQMLIKNTATGTRDFGFIYNQNNIIKVDDDDNGIVVTTVEDYMTLFNQSIISDDNITINDHWLNLNRLNYDDGSIGELYGLNVDFNISGSADVTTANHLINLEYTNTSSGSVVNPYAIYSSSDIPSFHRGDIEIGTGSNITIAGGGNVFVGSGKVHTGSSSGSATIEQDDLKLVRGTSGNPTVQGTAGAVTHTILFEVDGGSNSTLSTPSGYVGQIAVAHEKTPQIETGSVGSTSNSTSGKDFYYLKWTGGNGNATFNLPSATTNQYRTLQFITDLRVSANTTWTIDGSGAETIDGSTTYIINRAYEGIKLWSDGTEWIIIQAKK